MKTPEISIIIPCYNEEKNIFNTIKSISSHFNKTCFEISNQWFQWQYKKNYKFYTLNYKWEKKIKVKVIQ